jgi:hypothetical protein
VRLFGVGKKRNTEIISYVVTVTCAGDETKPAPEDGMVDMGGRDIVVRGRVAAAATSSVRALARQQTADMIIGVLVMKDPILEV